MRALTPILAVLALLPAVASAQQQDFFKDHPSGWLWYQQQPHHLKKRPHKPKPAPSPEAQQPQKVGPKKWTTEWVRKALPRLRDQAIDDPTKDNVSAYLTLQRYAVDKATRFAEVAHMVTQGNAGLDENARFPAATAAEHERISKAASALTQAVSQIGRSAGLFFFFRSDCPYCHMDLPVLRTLELETGLHITAISLDGQGINNALFPNYLINNGQAQRLGVTATPAFFLVRPPNLENIVPLGQGYMSLQQLEQRIVQQSYYHGWLTHQIYQQTRIAPTLYNASVPAKDQGDLPNGVRKLIENALKTAPEVSDTNTGDGRK